MDIRKKLEQCIYTDKNAWQNSNNVVKYECWCAGDETEYNGLCPSCKSSWLFFKCGPCGMLEIELHNNSIDVIHFDSDFIDSDDFLDLKIDFDGNDMKIIFYFYGDMDHIEEKLETRDVKQMYTALESFVKRHNIKMSIDNFFEKLPSLTFLQLIFDEMEPIKDDVDNITIEI